MELSDKSAISDRRKCTGSPLLQSAEAVERCDSTDCAQFFPLEKSNTLVVNQNKLRNIMTAKGQNLLEVHLPTDHFLMLGTP